MSSPPPRTPARQPIARQRDLTTWLARLGLRTRMLMLVAVAALPALAVLAHTQMSMAAETPIAHELTATLLVIGGALMSLGFGLMVGEHFIRRPADALLNAAGQWSSGNLDARIEIGASAGTEFGRVAGTFNGMAAALTEQRAELRDLNNDLESRVAARTQELRESNDRLVAEMAERTRAEMALREAQKLQAVGQLAGGIAHDFNNLLTTITGALDLVRGRLTPGQDPLLRLVDNALIAADHGGRLTGQLLSFSRRQRLSPVPTDMNATVSALNELLVSTLGKAVRIRTELAADLWPALVDPSQMEAAILNLALNARDAMPEGGTLTISTHNLVIDAGNALPAGDYVAVQIADTGIGMTDTVLQQAVDPFFTTKEPGSGSGLGLSQVHGLAAQSGGEVRLQSRSGAGTTAVVVLPRTLLVPFAQRDLPTGTVARPRTRQRLLVVDDDPGVLMMTGEMLSECGYTVTLADTADAALEILARDPGFDLLLTDFVMPGMNGLALIQAASELYPALRSMLMTGHTDLSAGDPIGAERIVQKPFNMAEIDDRVNRVLARPRLHVIEGGGQRLVG